MTRSLSFHSLYRCEHSGACCTAGWPIALEPSRVPPVREAILRSRLHPRGSSPFAGSDDVAGALLAVDRDGCAFYSPAARRCEIHRALGHDALPLACRQFPRVSLRDPRGISITLSHYCPTAARLLDTDDQPVAIVEHPPAFPAGGEYVGLDATEVLPPLLRPGLLMDWTAWWECERLAVDLVGNGSGSPSDAVAHLARVVATIQSWSPDDSDALIDRVAAAFDAPAADRVTLPSPEQLVNEARLAIPPELRPAVLPHAPRPNDRVVCRYLAAHVFANWHVLGPGGIDAWVRSIATALALLESGFGIRDADLWLRHLARGPQMEAGPSGPQTTPRP